MSKIIIEDHTQEALDTSKMFDEKYVVDYVNGFLPLVVEDSIKYGLAPKEIIFAMFCIAEIIKEYALATHEDMEEEYNAAYDWAKAQAKKWTEEVKASGLFDEVKKVLKEMKEQKEKKGAD